MKTIGPYFTVGKPALDQVRDRIEGSNGAFAIAVFVALRELSNYERKPDGPISATVSAIAAKASLSYSTTARVLQMLQRTGIVGIGHHRIPGTKALAPSVYSFLPIDRTSSRLMERTPLPLMEGTLGTGRPSRQPESIKEEKEYKESNLAPKALKGAEREESLPNLPSSKPRSERNLLFDALAEETDGPAEKLTRPASQACGVALATIRQVEPALTVDEIRRRAANYRAHFCGAALTASALARHWVRCASAKLAVTPFPGPHRHYPPLEA